MKTLLKPLLAASVLSLALGSVAMAKPEQGRDKQYHSMQKQGHHRSDQLRFLKGIDLTEAQKDQVFALTHAEMPKKRALMKARRALKQELMALSDNYTEAKAIAIADQLATVERDSVLARAHHHQKVLNVLTPAQKKQVAENKEKFKQRRELRPTKGKVSKRFHQNGSQSVTM